MVTAGAMREVLRKGSTQSCGGVVSPKIIEFVANNPGVYFEPREPGGMYMKQLNGVKEQLDSNTEAVLASGRKLVETATEANKKLAEVSGKFRDGTHKLSDAIDKLMKVAGRSDFSETVRLTESLVYSLERLAVLEERGVLDKVMKAMAR